MEFEVAKKAYLQKIKTAVVAGNVPLELIINFDESDVNIVPSSQWTQAEKGSKRVEISGFDHKHQITLTVAGILLLGNFYLFEFCTKGRQKDVIRHLLFQMGSMFGICPITGPIATLV